MKLIIQSLRTSLILFLFLSSILLGQEKQEIIAESNIFDVGKMWTFDYPPIDYLNTAYGFYPDQDWFDDIRLSALRIPGCTASFVSENGLIMTNNHCSERHRNRVQLDGENLAETGFYAESLKDERKVPNMYADQLVFIRDVTSEIIAAVDSAETPEERVKLKDDISRELIKRYNEETDLICQLVSLYNGGKYSIYGYKRFEDVRLVFVPEDEIAYFGGDLDNFTYPRYNLDCAFFRIYDEEGKPIQSPNYFKFSDYGVQDDEVIFSVGNPGSTYRLYTVSQLEYFRDISYRNRSFRYDEYYNLLGDAKLRYPERADEFEKMRTRIGNSQKVFHYTLAGLQDPYLIARKRDFEKNIRIEVEQNPDLSERYSDIWDDISTLREELKPIDSKLAAYRQSRFMGSAYFRNAEKIIDFAERIISGEKQLSSNQGIRDSIANEIFPEDFDFVLENMKLHVQLDYIRMNLGDENEFVELLCDDYQGEEAVKYLLNKSSISNEEKTLAFLSKSPEEILDSNDPFIYFIKNTKDEISKLNEKSRTIKNTEDALVNMLGKVIFEIYGTEIPPDANFTLRLSDGILESFKYNGTEAIERTTFYGLYNRYYGSSKRYPWNLPERWVNPPDDFDMSTVFNFISTNDIIGGNSGSAVINKDAEVVGLAFDGNIESIIGDFIYLPEDNRMVSVSSQAILQALDKIYGASRIYNELKTGTHSK